jgi:hypothetical protein
MIVRFALAMSERHSDAQGVPIRTVSHTYNTHDSPATITGFTGGNGNRFRGF